MRLLLIHRYFWPDAPPYASMLRTIGARLAADGHRVTVLSAQPSYNAATAAQRRPAREELDGMQIHRVPLLGGGGRGMRRLVDTALFLLQVFWVVCWRRDDLVMFSTMPPVALGVVVRAAQALTGRAGRYVYHCQDLYPETALVGGLLRSGPWYRVLRRIDAATCRRAAAVVVLSGDMRDTVARRGVDHRNIHVLNNFALAEPGRAVARPPGLPARRDPDDYVVAFAGNLGRFQQLDTLVDAALRLRDEPGIQFWIVGDGVLRDELHRQAGALAGQTVQFAGYQPPPVAFGLLEDADLAVVSLRPGMYRVAFPSKTMTALMAGCRLLIVAEGDSELARIVRGADLGNNVPPGDAAALADAIRTERRRSGNADRDRARAYATEHYSADTVCDAWVRLIKRVGDRAVVPR